MARREAEPMLQRDSQQAQSHETPMPLKPSPETLNPRPPRPKRHAAHNPRLLSI